MSVNLYRIGNWMLDTPSSAIVLKVPNASTIANGHFSTLQKQDGSALEGVSYQVTAGKTFYGLMLIFTPIAAGAQMAIAYADNAGFDVASGSLTNPRYATGALGGGGTAFVPNNIPIFFSIPAQKFPCVQAIQGTSPFVHIVGVEL